MTTLTTNVRTLFEMTPAQALAEIEEIRWHHRNGTIEGQVASALYRRAGLARIEYPNGPDWLPVRDNERLIVHKGRNFLCQEDRPEGTWLVAGQSAVGNGVLVIYVDNRPRPPLGEADTAALVTAFRQGRDVTDNPTDPFGLGEPRWWNKDHHKWLIPNDGVAVIAGPAHPRGRQYDRMDGWGRGWILSSSDVSGTGLLSGEEDLRRLLEQDTLADRVPA